MADHEPVVIKDQPITQVTTYKYLGIQIDNHLRWITHIDTLCNKLQQRLYHLRRLRLFGVRKQILMLFYRSILESVIRYGITVWFGNLTVQLKNRLVSMHKMAKKIVGEKDYISLDNLYKKAALNKADKIIADFNHPLHTEYEILPLGRRLRLPKCNLNRYKLSFIPASTKMINSSKPKKNR